MGYDCPKSGTSMASPNIAGIVAGLLQANDALTFAELQTIFSSESNGYPISNLPYGSSSTTGYSVSCDALYSIATGGNSPNPSPTSSTTAPPPPVDTTIIDCTTLDGFDVYLPNNRRARRSVEYFVDATGITMRAKKSYSIWVQRDIDISQYSTPYIVIGLETDSNTAFVTYTCNGVETDVALSIGTNDVDIQPVDCSTLTLKVGVSGTGNRALRTAKLISIVVYASQSQASVHHNSFTMHEIGNDGFTTNGLDDDDKDEDNNMNLFVKISIGVVCALFFCAVTAIIWFCAKKKRKSVKLQKEINNINQEIIEVEVNKGNETNKDVVPEMVQTDSKKQAVQTPKTPFLDSMDGDIDFAYKMKANGGPFPDVTGKKV